MSARNLLALMLVGFSPAVSAATYSCELQRFASVQFDKNLGVKEPLFEKEVIPFNLVVTADGGEIVAPGVRSKLVRLPTDDPKELQFAEPTQGIFNFFSFFPDSGLIVRHKSYKSPNADGPYISMGWGKCK